jgi:3-methyladenine DNA glycosylase AlkD
MPGTVSAELVGELRRVLAAGADPERAQAQQRYMKSAMPYWGLTLPALRAAVRPVLADPAHRIQRRPDWEATVLALWDNASHREERYAAIELAGHRHYVPWQDVGTLTLYRHLIVTGAWWDLVDGVAAEQVGGILGADRADVTPIVRAWAVEQDMWLRRAAIISQLGHQERTDLELLGDVIDANLEGTAYGSEFFIRKAIGWALRQHARVAPDWVRAFVAARADRLSGLSRREALKHL